MISRMDARWLRAVTVAMLVIVSSLSVMATCVAAAVTDDGMACCAHGRVAEAGAATMPECCRIGKPAQAPVASIQALPDLKSMIATGPIGSAEIAPIASLHATYPLRPSAASSPPVLQRSSALRL